MQVTSGSKNIDSATRILDAAASSLRDVGFRRTSMVEIAQRADVSRTTLYRHWSDLTALLRQVITRELTEALADIPFRTDVVENFVADATLAADRLREHEMLRAAREHDRIFLAKYAFERFGSSQSAIYELIEVSLKSTAANDSRICSDHLSITCAMTFLLLQGALLTAPVMQDHLTDEQWRTELERALLAYLTS